MVKFEVTVFNSFDRNLEKINIKAYPKNFNGNRAELTIFNIEKNNQKSQIYKIDETTTVH